MSAKSEPLKEGPPLFLKSNWHVTVITRWLSQSKVAYRLNMRTREIRIVGEQYSEKGPK